MTRPDDDPGVPLDHYRQHAGCGVRFCCQACAWSADVALEAVIARLERRRLGDARTGIRAVARLSHRPCPRCGAQAWDTRPAFPGGLGNGV